VRFALGGTPPDSHFAQSKKKETIPMNTVKLLSAAAAVFFILAASGTVFAQEDAAEEPAAVAAEAPAVETEQPAAEEAVKEAKEPAAEATATAEEKPAADGEKPAEPSLYEKLPEGAIAKAVDKFYEKVLADDRVNGFFKGVDMDRQRAMQTAFLTYAFGGPNHYEGRDLRAVHAHLVARGLNDTHFDIIVEHLGNTLKEMGVSDADIAQAAKVANSVRNDVLNK
jgi:hemoglobin